MNNKPVPQKTLEDDSLMPFGKFQGTPMKDVPASYLFWCWCNASGECSHMVKDYIKRNLAALKHEYPDGIW